MFAQIVTEIAVKSLDRAFTYRIPSSLEGDLRVGSLVKVPFGQGNRIISGYVISINETTDFDPDRTKEIVEIIEGVTYEQELLNLAHWMKKRYMTTLPTALKTLLPTKPTTSDKKIRMVYCPLTKDQLTRLIESYQGKKSFEPRVRALQVLIDKPRLPLSQLTEEAGVSQGVFDTLKKHDLIQIYYEKHNRMTYDVDDFEVTTNLVPNEDQAQAISRINQAIDREEEQIFLLHGVTGSGKTEVYMQVIEKALTEGKSAIVLIPEIGLTPQTVRRFVERFGDIVGVLHSRLSEGERYDAWQMAKDGEIKVMIGPRSAVFAPFKELGVIILDEEHETTYKSEMPPKYHAREVAIYRGHYHHCPVVLGSATPLVETYYKALSGAYELLKLRDKAAAIAPLITHVIDLREELALGNKTIFSAELKTAIDTAISKREQVILFLNRRGYASFVSCRRCGHVLKCDHCDVSFNYHKYKNALVCHYCGKEDSMVGTCPNCGSPHIKDFGVGTQKVEAQVAKVFPQARILRMDYDTTGGKKGHETILEAFGNHEADILIGTQMVAKGHHFDNVTLVGVLAADMSLNTNDFRAAERTFQLLTQVMGRAGRGSKAGKAYIQTYTPEHYSIQCARNQDYEAFYDNEIGYRALMGYPPFKHMLTVLMSCKEERYVIRASHSLKEHLYAYEEKGYVEVLGPTPATVSKVQDHYRQVVYLKADNYNLLTQVADALYNIIRTIDIRNIISVGLDINPMMMQ